MSRFHVILWLLVGAFAVTACLLLYSPSHRVDLGGGYYVDYEGALGRFVGYDHRLDPRSKSGWIRLTREHNGATDYLILSRPPEDEDYVTDDRNTWLELAKDLGAQPWPPQLLVLNVQQYHEIGEFVVGKSADDAFFVLDRSLDDLVVGRRCEEIRAKLMASPRRAEQSTELDALENWIRSH